MRSVSRFFLGIVLVLVTECSWALCAEDRVVPIPPTLNDVFAARDTDQDNSVNLEEFLAGVPDEQQAVLRRNFRVIDLDDNGSLSQGEFGLIPGSPGNPDERAIVHDPIQMLETAELQKWKEQFKAIDKDQDGGLSVAEWGLVKWSPLTVGLAQVPFEVWDTNQNAMIDMNEGDLVFQQAFSLIRPKGGKIRTPHGLSINWIHIRQLDLNRDDQLSRDEFVKGFYAGPDRNVEIFTALDTDVDGIASIAELCNGPWFRFDLIGWFLAWDDNLDAELDDSEIAAHTAPWQRAIGQRLMGAFDHDRNQKLSLREALSSPFVDYNTDWYALRHDVDHDGFLSWQEFHPEEGTAGIAISRYFFDRFDRDQNGLLSLDEYTFHIDWQMIPVEVAFRAKDIDHDGQLKLEEIFLLELDPQADEVTRAQFDARRKYHDHWLQSSDINHDSSLSVEEYQQGRSRLHPAMFDAFVQRDSNNDGGMSLDEYLSHVDEPLKEKGRRDFLVVDWNRDAKLDWKEFSCLPGIIAGRSRESVPDPIKSDVESQLSKIVALLHQYSPQTDDHWAKDAWPSSEIGKQFPELKEVPASAWDFDQDGRITQAECRRMLEVSLGVRHISGGLNRIPNGVVLNVIQIDRSDLNKDLLLSQKEFLATFPGDPKLLDGIFASIDRDRSGVLEWDEMVNSPYLSVDVLDQFWNYDSDLNGTLNQHELDARCAPWQRNIGKWLIRAFDEDGDGQLSFLEFRSSPFENVIADWFSPPWDRDHDAQISWTEYVTKGSPELAGLYRKYFNAFDRDKSGRLSLDEFVFQYDRNKIPAEAFFKVIDTNHDGKVVLSEVLKLIPESPVDTASRSPHEARRQYYAAWFGGADHDESGSLSPEEFGLGLVHFQPAGFDAFLNRDANQDGKVSLDEYLAPVDEPLKSKSRRDFRVVDWGGDSNLDWNEFSCLPGIVPTPARGAVPDPIVDHVDLLFTKILAILNKRFSPTDEGWAKGKWPTSEIGRIAPELNGLAASAWDLNRDGQITEEECNNFLEILFGVRHPSGGRMRLPNGCVLTAIQLDRSDLNKDHTLSQREFLTTYPADPRQLKPIFDGIDQDHNGILDWNEMVNSAYLSADVLNQFFDYDTDFSGSLDQKELDAKCAPWQRKLGKRLLRGFDEDQDGRLSFGEFRSTPFDNLIADWYSPPQDSDNDAQISWTEFYSRTPPQLSGLYRHYFTAFDRDQNGRLTADEFDFGVDFNRISTEAAFAIQDSNKDGNLDANECFTETKPTTTKKEELDQYERRLAAAESQFLADDRDRSGGVDLKEYRQARQASLRAAELQRKMTARITGNGDDGWTFNLFLILHGIIAVGIVAYFLLPRSNSEKGANR